MGCVTLLLSLSEQKPSFLLRNSGHCEMQFYVFRQRVPNAFPFCEFKVLFWCLFSCVLSVYLWRFLSLMQSYSLAYSNSWEQQRYSAFKIRVRLFVFIDAKKREVWNYWSYNTFCYQKAAQNDSVSPLGGSELSCCASWLNSALMTKTSLLKKIFQDCWLR